ncbi:outer membrane protein assembly factor BamB family protein [Novipirellula artificiosorum]|uniref:Outer membrane biogenesis protein BamB n=1 Tax=Novipirellula artificiosorum TaxID=2528016 RepID=A0A5C6DCL8_9BACT|nr:PQQ-binding-like beta-propeller repeat protein [Novipirellula artificiosorum]TWU34512.1 outer membrane biogenesis protein BamB [Novipirellula artificiosorum]
MLANELIDRLERRGLLDQEIIEALREQLEQGTRVTPEAVAKLLVDNGQLTRYQATKLIGEIRSGEYEEEEESEEAAAGFDDLGIVPEDDEEEVVEAVAEAEPVAEVYAEPVAQPVAAESIPAADVPPPSRPVRQKHKPMQHKSVWDSFKIYGYAGIIIALLLSFVGLYFMLTRQSADEYISEANGLYDAQNFVPAQERYLGFIDTFGDGNQYSSLARTRLVMIELYRAETMSDPTRALDLAKEKLPPIEQEPGLNQERGNLAALLVDIAENIADAAAKAKDTSEKERLLGRLEDQMALMDNANYMTGSMKTTLSGKIQAVTEERDRVRRDINRNIRLDESVAAMQKMLDEKKTEEAYDIRFGLLREFPELYNNDRLMVLIQKASEIQQALVKPATDLPELVDESEPESTNRSIVLTTVEGEEAADLDGEILYLDAGGSMLAFDGETGRLLWRKFVGYGQDHLPVRLDDGSGVLLSESKKLEVQRCDGQDGVIRWRSKIGEPFSEPIAERDDIFVSSVSGRLAALDSDSGEAQWATLIPQPLDTGPGVDPRVNRAYLPGNHSNLYVLNSRDGSCLESYYIGHAEGTISVPPVPLYEHLFVFENAGSDYARIHILRTNKTGDELKPAQATIRVTGNVKIRPIVQGSRVIVLTDRGQVMVLEVEPGAEREQVRVVAEQVASYDEPTSTQMAVGKSQMWVTGTRIGRYELQINTGRVVQDWFKYPADNFIGQPFASNDTLVHARVLRGTSAIRVTAADAKSGQEIWRTDVGVPIAMITPVPNGGGFYAITTQATLFELDRESLATGSTQQGPIENPGGTGIAMRFEKPIRIDDSRVLMLNQTGSGEAIVLDPSRKREKLRRLQLGFGSGKPNTVKNANAAIVAGGGLFVPLNTGRAVLMDWQTGAMKGSPFQPAAAPEGIVQWSQPVALPGDPNQVVIADSRKLLYRIRVGDQVRPLDEVKIDNPFLGPVAAVGDTLVATVAGPSADFVVGHSFADLSETFKILLDGRSVWGPVAANDYCVLVTNDSVLRAFGADGKQRFELELPKGEPVAAPIQVGDVMLLAGKEGWLVAFDPATGEIKGRADIGQPISSSPLQVNDRLLVPGGEGVVYITDVPSQP